MHLGSNKNSLVFVFEYLYIILFQNDLKAFGKVYSSKIWDRN